MPASVQTGVGGRPRSPGAPTLLLIPTELEREHLLRAGGWGTGHALCELCGFGPVAAAARTATLVERLAPRRVVLLGIAGTYDEERAPLGSATSFATVAVDGVGTGEGEEHVAASALGFAHWPGLDERLELELAPVQSDAPLLLTVCASASSSGAVARRRARFPGAVAEDMEGFGVALACALAGVPLTVVRGMSNLAGERDKERWCIPAALESARRMVQELLEQVR